MFHEQSPPFCRFRPQRGDIAHFEKQWTSRPFIFALHRSPAGHVNLFLLFTDTDFSIDFSIFILLSSYHEKAAKALCVGQIQTSV